MGGDVTVGAAAGAAFSRAVEPGAAALGGPAGLTPAHRDVVDLDLIGRTPDCRRGGAGQIGRASADAEHEHGRGEEASHDHLMKLIFN